MQLSDILRFSQRFYTNIQILIYWTVAENCRKKTLMDIIFQVNLCSSHVTRVARVFHMHNPFADRQVRFF